MSCGAVSRILESATELCESYAITALRVKLHRGDKRPPPSGCHHRKGRAYRAIMSVCLIRSWVPNRFWNLYSSRAGPRIQRPSVNTIKNRRGTTLNVLSSQTGSVPESRLRSWRLCARAVNATGDHKHDERVIKTKRCEDWKWNRDEWLWERESVLVWEGIYSFFNY